MAVLSVIPYLVYFLGPFLLAFVLRKKFPGIGLRTFALGMPAFLIA